MKKKIIIVIVAAIAVTTGVYFAVLQNRIETVSTIPTLEESFGIWESQQNIVSNPGARQNATLTILNGPGQDRWVWVSLEQPSLEHLPNGYEPFPEENYDWFTLTGWNGTHKTKEPAIYIEAGCYYQLAIPIEVPYDTDFLYRHAELRVQVTEINPGAFQLNAVASKWYIYVTNEEIEGGVKYIDESGEEIDVSAS